MGANNLRNIGFSFTTSEAGIHEFARFLPGYTLPDGDCFIIPVLFFEHLYKFRCRSQDNICTRPAEFGLLAKTTQQANRLRPGGFTGPDIHSGITDHQAKLGRYSHGLRGIENWIRIGLGMRGGLPRNDHLEERR